MTPTRVRDARLLRQQQKVEQQCLDASLTALRAEVLARFGVRAGPRPLRANAVRGYAAQFVSAMRVSYLYGAYHIQKLLQPGSRSIQLAQTPFQVPFAEAEDFLRAQVATPRLLKDTLQAEDTFDTLDAKLKFRAFTIAKVGQEDLIRQIQGLYQTQLRSGAARADLTQQMAGLLEQAGIGVRNPYWLETHYRNNMMNAYNAGRWQQLQDTETVQYLQYNAILDEGTTELCDELDGLILVRNDKRWQTIYPQNHHSCRSIVTPISYEEAQARKLQPSSFDLGEITRNPAMKKQLQFPAHPAAVLDVVPLGMAARAQQYGLWPDILKFAARANRPFWQKRRKDLAKAQIGKRVQAHVAQKRPELNPDDFHAALTAPDEVWISMTKDTSAGARQSVLLIKWVSEQVGHLVAARVSGGPKTFYPITRAQLKQRERKHGWYQL